MTNPNEKFEIGETVYIYYKGSVYRGFISVIESFAVRHDVEDAKPRFIKTMYYTKALDCVEERRYEGYVKYHLYSIAEIKKDSFIPEIATRTKQEMEEKINELRQKELDKLNNL